MERPIFTYTENKKNASVLRKEFNLEFDNLYLKGDPLKLKEGLGVFNEEAAIISLGKFIPGKIYTFDYDPINKDVLSYYDKRPLIFVHSTYKAGTGNDIVTGVNLNFLPEEARIHALDLFWQNFSNDIQKSEDKAENNKIYLALNKIVSFFKNWVSVLKVYNGGGGLGYQYAYRNYAVSHIKNPRYIEYNHWEMIPFLNPKFFNGASVQEVYKLYWTQQMALNKKPTK